MDRNLSIVMPRLVRGIHDFSVLPRGKLVDARNKCGHDGAWNGFPAILRIVDPFSHTPEEILTDR